ncbi:hypothetical protein BCT06_16970 [Vibrio breoganii]|uniref:type II toxin-antitoxin system HigB family toxin n=1 Tax=Vibrio breoganii TaxID=553239 RepID=UPI000C85ACCE|nr:type II toxin-antitoxin system HigB family toxin [Vibrio breoganii]PMO57299.1 hypothetical protein BCT06_16970 [Vibrio breoganii]
MRVVTTTHIKRAMMKHQQWRVGLSLWLQTFDRQGLSLNSFQGVKDKWSNASGWNVDRIPARKVGETGFQGDNFDVYIFDIHKNDCRIITRIDMARDKIFIRCVGSHAEYNKWVKAHVN